MSVRHCTASASKISDFSIPWCTAREWRNGRRAGLRIQCRKAWGFKSPLSHQPRKHREKNHMAEYIEVEQAIAMTGLRVVLSPGVPGPWSEAAKAILYVKKIPYVKVRQELGGGNVRLRHSPKQTTAPALVQTNEPTPSLSND